MGTKVIFMLYVLLGGFCCLESASAEVFQVMATVETEPVSRSGDIEDSAFFVGSTVKVNSNWPMFIGDGSRTPPKQGTSLIDDLGEMRKVWELGHHMGVGKELYPGTLRKTREMGIEPFYGGTVNPTVVRFRPDAWSAPLSEKGDSAAAMYKMDCKLVKGGEAGSYVGTYGVKWSQEGQLKGKVEAMTVAERSRSVH